MWLNYEACKGPLHIAFCAIILWVLGSRLVKSCFISAKR
ncbi:hypothetical protein PCIT_b0769 [Pseudoalteromonas citrea]|uniref:Uncharacterized protein n=1 Tax=Pseudoalteromonas citrea TaxID=43655 RepID=A0AAD4FQ57_9GAMM|nr:hypothetical protein PCIT_b0769 [Pseudoalteromonas citrea]